jgi:predicted TIM-barrel fold metal-dependent hydrolase
MEPTARPYVVISSDTHCGADLLDYKPYLESKYHDEFDVWAASYRDAWAELDAESGDHRVGVASYAADVNWNSEKRSGQLDAEGIAAEVLFPNTSPPFFPSGAITAPAPASPPVDRRIYELRFAGIRAHNRWVADFARERPGRRAGLAQVFLSDMDDTIAEVERAHADGLAGVLLPADHFSQLQNLYYRRYDRLWAKCVELGLSVGRHGVLPAEGNGEENGGTSEAIGLLEAMYFSQRPLIHMVMSGVFERFPRLRFVMTEQGSGWLPAALAQMDDLHRQTLDGRIGELAVAPEIVLPRPPSDYFRTNCYLGASFPAPQDAPLLEQLGIERVMWGSDYPHHEATTPYTREALRRSFAGWSPAALRRVLAGTAAEVYGFDLQQLAPIAARCGPALDEIATPLDDVPSDATSPAFFKP